MNLAANRSVLRRYYRKKSVAGDTLAKENKDLILDQDIFGVEERVRQVFDHVDCLFIRAMERAYMTVYLIGID